MGLIALEGMAFRAYHGVYAEEQVLGNDFVVDVYITTNFMMAAASDNLNHTISYETVYEICKMVMREPTRLIETLADRIIEGVKHQFQTVEEIKVRIRKLNPPLGGRIAHAMIETEENLEGQCGRCGRGIVCYGDSNCWCKGVQIHPRTQQAIMQQYKRCICAGCQKFFADK